MVLAGPGEEGPSGDVPALGLVSETEDSELAQGLWLSCRVRTCSWLLC